MTIELSVITPTRNRAKVLERCLACLAAQSLDPSRYEVIVVDDASTDGTPAVIDAARRSAACVIRSFSMAQRTGISAARNLAIREAGGEIIVFVDSDSLAPRAFLALHLDVHRRAGAAIVCRGPVVLTRSLERPFDARSSLLDISTAYFDTDNGSVRKDHLVTAGLFDEDLSPYGWEGLDMGFRLRALGLRRVFCRGAALYHYQPDVTPGSLAAMLAKEDERARTALRFFEKYPTLETRLALQLTPFHRALNTLQRLFGLIHPGNVESWLARAARWGIPGLGRLLLAGVLNERYLARLVEEGSHRRTDGTQHHRTNIQ
jgi:glycosyltransferase involved in cell wall biosynthesis